MDSLPARPVFSDSSLGPEEPQRPFRVSGLLSLLFGLISVGVLASTVLLFLPLIAILFALFAFRPSRDPSVVPAGRMLAVAGASLAIFFGGWALAQRMVQTRYMSDDGETFARNWLAVLEAGQRELAFELTLPPNERQLESMSLVEFYQTDTPALENFKGFTAQDVVQAILAADAPLEWELVDRSGPVRYEEAEMIILQFRDRSEQVPQAINVALLRIPPLPQDEATRGFYEEDDPATADLVQWHVFNIRYAD
ncbi:hypothetical protein [Candidatus Laterigemmans baculatus]|uniref:hypothetical protein n=1 Tax=Candidatus Laterigemmans baculatus TaxID=2770505 RepID=UPI0013DD0220|nr:hypothetical protein [Candidatus Laterigemmans baculatus]